MFNNNIKSTYLRNMPAGNRRGIVRLHLVPLIVWLCVLVGVVFLFNTRIQRFEVMGVANSKTWQVSAVETGRIKTLHVELFDLVIKDQVIASLGSEMIEAQLNTINAEVAKLAADLNAQRDQLNVDAQDRSNDLIIEHRRFSANVEEARLAVLELLAVIEPDRILLKDYQAEINIEKELLVTGAITATYNIEKAKAQYDTLARKIENNQKLLAQAQDNVEHSIKRRDEFHGLESVNLSPDIALEAIRKSIDVQQQLMQELVVQSESLILKAPADGIVMAVFGRAGEVVTAGLTILTIAQAESTEIIAYAGDESHNNIRLGQKVQLVKNGLKPQIAESQIVQVSPVIDVVPARLLLNPNLPQWGRPFIVKVPATMKLAPGEKVGIRGLHQ